MSQLELDRLEILNEVIAKRMGRIDAARALNLSERHVGRLLGALRRFGPPGIISRRRGKPSNNRLSPKLKLVVLELIRTHYDDFGPTFANEKIRELHGLKVSTETLRGWMIEEGLWIPRKRRNRIHQPRHRRECFGELIQIDGSDHDWFEGRGPRCTLLVYIDDATSQLMHLRFVKSETAFDYFDATRSYMEHYGKPVAFYSDKHTIFRTAHAATKNSERGQTQFGRALGELNVDIICANTPQAKGRVERANRTLQDRLVKELRLAGISSIEEANEYLPEFMAAHNARFAKPALNPKDVHRPVREVEDLDEIFTWQEERRLSKDLVLQFKSVQYHIEVVPETRELKGKRCRVYRWSDGRVMIRCEGQGLPYSIFDKNQRVKRAAIVENKRLSEALEFIRKKQVLMDEARLQSRRVLVRDKERIRERMRAEA